MGNLSNLYISQSFISLIHLGNDNTASTTPTVLQDGLGNSIGIYIDTLGNISASGNIYATNLTGSANDTGSFVTTSSFNAYTQSTNNTIAGLETTASYQIDSASFNTRINNVTFDTSSLVTTASFNSYTSSTNSRLNSIESKTGSYATTGSNTFNGNQNIIGDITASNLSVGTINATTIHTIIESSSVIFSSGSNILGDELTDTQILSGSVKVVGNLTVNGTNVSTQSFVDLGPLNSFTASQQFLNQTFATTASFNAYTQSTNTFTASISTSVGLLQTFSSSQYIADSSSFTSRINAIVPIVGYATTGSNTFVGQQIISSSVKIVTSGSADIESLRLLPWLSSSTFNGVRDLTIVSRGAATGAGSAQLTQSVVSPVNLIFGGTNPAVSASMIVSGSNNVILASRTTATNASEVIANNSIFAAAPATLANPYAPVLITNTTINSAPGILNSNLGLSSSAALGFPGFGVGYAAQIIGSNLNGGLTITPASGSVLLNLATINGTTTINSNKSDSWSAGAYALQSGSQTAITSVGIFGTTTITDRASVSGSGGGSQFLRGIAAGNVTIANIQAATSNNNLQNFAVIGAGLIITGSEAVGATNGGTAIFGRFANDDGFTNNSAFSTFAIGAGTAAGSRKTPFWISTSGSVNITGSTVFSELTGSLATFSGSVATLQSSYTSMSASAVSNVTDTYSSYPSTKYIVTLSSAEYAAIVTPDANTLYIVI